MRLALVTSLFLMGCPAITDEVLADRLDQDRDGFSAAQFGGDDCDDTNAEIFPGAADEPYDDVDADCNGGSDNDADGDGFDDVGHAGDDCDDTKADIHPGADETCDGLDNDCDGTTGPDELDSDGDGHFLCGDDCDDTNPAIFTGSTEVCDELNTDEDCDGSVDDADADATGKSTWYRDSDGDSYGDPADFGTACDAPAGFVADNTDCDDDNGAVNPENIWYADEDGDSFGDPDDFTVACEPPGDEVEDNTDCDDSSGIIYPGAPDDPYDGVDADCAGDSDNDADHDGYDDVGHGGSDCDDARSSVSPGATEVCDGVDTNCDGATPSDELDADADGYRVCDGDCDDTFAAANPGQVEVCDALNADEDCDGSTDDGDASASGKTAWFRDSDNDEYGDPTITASACDVPAGFVADNTDCDDGDAEINPETSWYADADGDSYGDASFGLSVCDGPVDYVRDNSDCDDANAAVNPGATEVCNEIDDNCGGGIDAADPEVDPDEAVWYRDRDADGYGDASVSVVTCITPTGYVHEAGDCDDAASTINEGEAEVCDGEDNDCDGSIDDADADVVDQANWYRDADGDEYGDDTALKISCFEPSGYVATPGDCDDASSGISPAVVEICDGLDDDCDGLVDDDDPTVSDQATWYADADGDGFGNAAISLGSCGPGGAWVLDDADCDDTDTAVNPAAVESWYDGVDQDCDARSDDDQDFDGHDAEAYGGDDCDDLDATISPSELEVWYDGVDADCDGASDYDQDVDGYDTTASGGSDCDDLLNSTNPGATETWYDGVDADCNGASDYDQDADGYDADAYGGDDCDDTEATVSPAMSESLGDDLDNDCDGIIDGFDASAANAILTGVAMNDAVGNAVANQGDNDDDGYDDILVGATSEDAGGNAAGAVYLVRAPLSGTSSLSAATAKIIGEDALDYAGASVAFCDTDNDGDADILVGANGDDSGGTTSGSAYLISAPTSGSIDLSTAAAKFVGENANDNAGGVVGCGDFNDDGYGDIMVGSYYNATGTSYSGAVYVLNGPKSGTIDLSLATSKLRGESNGDYAGEDSANLGDVDGDGIDDLIVGAMNNYAGGSQAGAAYLVLGPLTAGVTSLASADAKYIGEDAYDYAGEAVSAAGDVDGDGNRDLLVGGEGDDTTGSTCGAAWLITSRKSGSVDLSLFDAKITGEGTEDYAGMRLAGPGDINLDGKSEIIVASPFDGNYGVKNGWAWLFSGPISGTHTTADADLLISGTASQDYLSQSLAAGGDNDADGQPDLILAAPGSDLAASYAGAAYLFSGASVD